MRRRGLRRVLPVALAGVLLTTAACGAEEDEPVVSGLQVDDQDGYDAARPARPYPVRPATLTRADGADFRFGRDTQGTVSLVFFGYTKCPDTCQVVMSTIASAYQRLEPAVRRQVRVLFVTTDPARDTGPVLTSYLDRFNPAFTGLTAPLRDIVRLGKPWGIDIAKGRRLPSGGYEVDHTTSVLGLDGRGDPQGIPLVWSASTSPVAMAADLTKLLGAPPS